MPVLRVLQGQEAFKQPKVVYQRLSFICTITRAAVGIGILMGMGVIFHPTDPWGFLINLK